MRYLNFKKIPEKFVLRLVILTLVICLSLLVRLYFFEVRSLDFLDFLDPWYQFIVSNGRFFALKHNFSNYNVPYLYLMVAASYIFPKASSLFVVKFISISFDFLNAFWIYKITSLKNKKKYWEPTLYTSIFLFAPTIFINSSFWAQADGIYTSFLLAFIYFLIRKQPNIALIFFSVAVSFKLQAIFLTPIVIVLLFKKYISLKSLLVLPTTYLVMLVPAWIAGREFKDLLLIYLNQASTYRDLVKAAPNLYQWIPNKYYSLVLPIGLGGTIVVTAVAIILLSRKEFGISSFMIVQSSFLFALMIPYCLPKMHDRYFYVADVMSIIYTCYKPERWYLSVIIIFGSLFCYMPFLLDTRMVSLAVISLFFAFALIQLIFDLKYALKKPVKDQEYINLS